MTKISSYKVEGSSSTYVVKYDHENEFYTCTCPDFIHRCSKTNEMCKHIQKIKNLDDNGVVLEHDTYELDDAPSNTTVDRKRDFVDESTTVSLDCTRDERKDNVVDHLFKIVENQQLIINRSMDILSLSFEKLDIKKI